MRRRRQQFNEELGRVFESYDRSVPEMDASPDFLPGIWRRIEESRSLGWLAPLQLWSQARWVFGSLGLWPSESAARRGANIGCYAAFTSARFSPRVSCTSCNSNEIN